jgi:hypothetical protein
LGVTPCLNNPFIMAVYRPLVGTFKFVSTHQYLSISSRSMFVSIDDLVGRLRREELRSPSYTEYRD